MTDPNPSTEDVERARKFAEEERLPSILMLSERHRLALEFASVRAEERERCARLMDQKAMVCVEVARDPATFKDKVAMYAQRAKDFEEAEAMIRALT